MNLKNLDLEELTQQLAPLRPTPTAVLKLFARVFAFHAKTVEELRHTPQLPRAVRDHVLAHAQLPALTIIERRKASDGFVKYLFESPAGGRIEAVRIPLFDEKYVVCISSQVGCALACDFCMTGKMGFKRNLATWEMVDQVLQIRGEADRPVRGVVFMGMGEPLLNYEQALRAARILQHPAGLAISGKAITFSTAGWVPGIRRYIREKQPYRLAFSITSAIPEKRAQVLPVENTHPLSSLVEVIREYALSRRERAMLAYVLIRGFNTGREDAEALARVFEGIPIKIDLIDVTDPSGTYQPPDEAELKAFRNHLQILKSPIARRYSGGKEIGAACGTLEASRYGGQLLGADPWPSRTPSAGGPHLRLGDEGSPERFSPDERWLAATRIRRILSGEERSPVPIPPIVPEPPSREPSGNAPWLGGRLTRRGLIKAAGVGGLLLGGGSWLYKTVWRIGPPGPGLTCLTQDEFAICEKVGEAFFPGAPHSPLSAAEVNLGRFVDQYVGGMYEDQVFLFKMLFRALNLQPVLSYGSSFHWLSVEDRQRVLHDWGASSLLTRRIGYHTLRFIYSMGYFEDTRVRSALGLRFGCPLPERAERLPPVPLQKVMG